MIKKLVIKLSFVSVIIFISCSVTSKIQFTKIRSEQLTITPVKQTVINNMAVPNGQWIYLATLFKNNSSNPIIIDFDDIYLLDNKNDKLRVEFVSGIRIDSDDKLYLELKPKSEIKKRITFLIKEGNHTVSMLYGDKKVKINFVKD